jgi:sulfur relay (sulfurtransferase) DsrC/TusE family protein
MRTKAVSRDELDKLIAQAKKGQLSKPDQVILAYEIEYYRNAALRTENAIRELVKDAERRGDYAISGISDNDYRE